MLAKQCRLTRWQAQQLLAGRSKLFLGKYKLLAGIGQGGMGTVLKAEHPGLNRIVALKVMSREVLGNPDAVARFVREIQLAAALDHPHIVRAYDADCVGKTYFLVMEYIEGDELKAWIHQHGQGRSIGSSCRVSGSGGALVPRFRRRSLNPVFRSFFDASEEPRPSDGLMTRLVGKPTHNATHRA